MRFEFEEEESLRQQHMTHEEAQEVIALWTEKRKERDQLSTMPTVRDVAEGLEIPHDEARQLLQEVRARKSAQAQFPTLTPYAIEKPSTAQVRIAIFVALVAVAVAMLIGLILTSVRTSVHVDSTTPAPFAAPATPTSPVPPSAR